MESPFRNRIRRGDAGAFAELYDEAAPALAERARAAGADAGATLLTTFLEAWRRRQRVDLHGESLLPWLEGVAASVLARPARYRRRYRGPLRRLPAAAAPAALRSAVLDAIEREPRRRSRRNANRAAAGAVLVICALGIAVAIPSLSQKPNPNPSGQARLAERASSPAPSASPCPPRRQRRAAAAPARCH